jgi:hypothetical protein
MATQVAFSTWQTGVAQLFASEDFLGAFTAAIAELSDGKPNPEILAGAFANGFSFKNPGFGPNFWTFSNTGHTLHVDMRGVRVSVDTPTVIGSAYSMPQPADSARALRVAHSLAAAVGRDMWLRTFLVPYPGIDPPVPVRS